MLAISTNDLPTVNAGLNLISAAFLIVGYRLIRSGRVTAHRNCMLAAFTTSTLFLAGYLYYHAHAGHTTFQEPAGFRPIYLGLLLTHVVLAALMVPMILATLALALRKRFDYHRRLARWTWPIWVYVSITGVLIYLLLYHIFPQPAT